MSHTFPRAALAVLLLAACSGSADPSPTEPTPTATATAAPTATDTAAPTPEPTATPAPTVAPTATQTPDAPTATPATPTPIAFADMSFTEKQVYMATTVLPAMTEVFQAFDPNKFRNMSCNTCHGSDAVSNNYQMPGNIHPLNPNNMPTADSPNAEDAEYAVFMGDTVTPMMVELLGYAPYDAQTGEGFGCFGCHPSIQPPQ